jgi:hypothetical protein
VRRDQRHLRQRNDVFMTKLTESTKRKLNRKAAPHPNISICDGSRTQTGKLIICRAVVFMFPPALFFPLILLVVLLMKYN